MILFVKNISGKSFWILLIYIQVMSSISAQQSIDEQELFFDVTGFIEARLGYRIMDDNNEKNTSIGELRLQLETEKDFEDATLNIVTDIVVDPVMDEYGTDLDTGEGIVDLRQFNLEFSPLGNMDVKLGRQILTWGTGDLLFINDLFAKDWNSFLIGRDTEYLKAPTDALKMSVFFETYNVDVIYTPRFSADRYINGSRVSFYDVQTQTSRGNETLLDVEQRNNTFTDDELSLRLYRSFGTVEGAVYYYNGFWKSPAGLDIETGKALFPELQVLGGSVRASIAKGIGNVEIGYYLSASSAESNATSRNSEFRVLLGYEQELATDLTGSVQYYLEHKINYLSYLGSLPDGIPSDDKNRQVVTFRLTKLLLQQNFKLSLLNFYSPTDKDGYTRFIASYKVTDTVKSEIGLNYFYGKDNHTFYSQFKNNSNIYTSLRYQF